MKERQNFINKSYIGGIKMFTEEYFSKWFDIIPEHDARMLWNDGDRSFLVLNIEDGTDRYADCFESFEEIERSFPDALFGLDKANQRKDGYCKMKALINSAELTKRIIDCISDGYDDEENREETEKLLYDSLSQLNNDNPIKQL